MDGSPTLLFAAFFRIGICDEAAGNPRTWDFSSQIQENPANLLDSTISLPIEGMTCASCVGRVERSLGKVEGVRSVSVNLATERADIHASGNIDRTALVHR